MPRNNLFKLILLYLSIGLTLQDVSDIRRKQNAHKPKELTNSVISKISDMNDIAHFNEILDNILIPRVVGTENHKKVREYIVKELKDLQWTIEFDEFDDKTPNMGTLTFTNVIAKLNPNAERYLVMACHYDSKYFPDAEFLGATDSAVPCAMLINMANTMSTQLTKVKDNNDLSLMFIFFDGEEAFKEWKADDSIYGARHLAKKYEDEGFLPKMDILILLDLLGVPDPAFYNINPETLSWYLRLERTENTLGSMSLLKSYTQSGVSREDPPRYFQQQSIHAGIEDDHIPFMRRNVKILHLIPLPFPTVWHKIEDDRKAIDVDTVENLMKILRVFIVEYLHIDIDE